MNVIGSFWDQLGQAFSNIWAKLRTPGSAVDPILAQIASAEDLPREEALALLYELERKLNAGDLPGTAEEQSGLRAIITEGINTLLLEEVSEPAEVPTDVIAQFDSLDDALAMAKQTLTYEAIAWGEEWYAKVFDRFARVGSVFFARGGQPIVLNNQINVRLNQQTLVSYVDTMVDRIELDIINARRCGDIYGIDEIKTAITTLYEDFKSRKTVLTEKLRGFMDVYELLLGMQNVTNVINQYVVGHIFLFLGKMVKPIAWLASKTRLGPQARLQNDIKYTERLRERLMEKLAHGYTPQIQHAIDAYNNTLRDLYAQTWAGRLAGQLTTEEIIAHVGQIPSYPEAGTLYKNLPAVMGILAQQVSTYLESNAEETINRAVPGGVAALTKDIQNRRAQGEEVDLEAAVNKWLTAHQAALVEAFNGAAADKLEELVISVPSVAAGGAEIMTVIVNAWHNEVQNYYEGIMRTSDYGIAVGLYGKLHAMLEDPVPNDEKMWAQGLETSARVYLMGLARENEKLGQLTVDVMRELK